MQFTISDIQAMADPRSFQRGVEYFKRGQVRQMDYRSGETLFQAKVSGSGRQMYTASVYLDDFGLNGDCTCPVAVDCKHCVAAALEWQRLYFDGRPVQAVSPETLRWESVEDVEGWQLIPVLADRDNWLLIGTSHPAFSTGMPASLAS